MNGKIRPRQIFLVPTRYRDIPFEEAAKHLNVGDGADEVEDWDTEMRGLKVIIETPAIEVIDPKCEGPFFRVHNGVGCICPHVAEIGD